MLAGTIDEKVEDIFHILKDQDMNNRSHNQAEPGSIWDCCRYDCLGIPLHFKGHIRREYLEVYQVLSAYSRDTRGKN